MTELLKNINDVSVANTYKTHDLLDRVLTLENLQFPTNEIKFDNEHVTFVTTVDEYTLLTQRDLNNFVVVARVAKGNDVLAECTIDILGQFNERYARISDVEFKNKISSWFTEIGNIDITQLVSGEPAAAEENVSEEAPTAEPEKVEAEVVSEGESATK